MKVMVGKQDGIKERWQRRRRKRRRAKGEGLSANEKVVRDESAITTHPSGPGHTGTQWGEEGGRGSGKQIWEAGGGEGEESVEGRGKKKCRVD